TRYPVLVMEWIDGTNLDVYIDVVINRPDASRLLRALADEFCRTVVELESAGVAHGDLQHGNLIVTTSGIRVVDLDGMFVPALRGKRATELGHRHFQHPKRTEECFDETLDRFPSLVIYVSLCALSSDPRLWRDFHDDNLIFRAEDFAQPVTSEVFKRIK